MSNINKSNHSPAEVARYLGVPESSISVRYAKDANNTSKALHEHWSSITHPTTGKSLSSFKGYYVGEKCVYAEYADSSGTPYCYIQHPGKSVSSQMTADQGASSNGKINCSSGAGVTACSNDLTQLNYTSLKILERALEQFISPIQRECDCMRSCIAECQPFLRDQISQDEFVNKSYKIVEDIEETIAPTKRTKDKVSELLAELRRLALYD